MKPENLIYIDVETVPIAKTYDDLDVEQQTLWIENIKYSKEYNTYDILGLQASWEKAGFYPEFAKIVCIGIGYFERDTDSDKVKYKTSLHISADNERLIIQEAFEQITRLSSNRDGIMSYDGRRFDYPFMIKRAIIRGILLPEFFKIINKKPWDVKLYDMKEIWKFGGTSNISINALAKSLQIELPKKQYDKIDIPKVIGENSGILNIQNHCFNHITCLVMIYFRVLYNTEVKLKYRE